MKNIDEFLIENGLCQTLLSNQEYIIDANFIFNGQDLYSKMIIDGLKLTGIEKTDAIIIIDLLVKLYYIQWKEQYKYREYFEPMIDKKYSAKIQLKDFDYSINEHNGFGIMLNAKKKNTILMFSMVSFTSFIEDNIQLKSNQFLRKLIGFYENIESYIDITMLYTPHRMLNDAIVKFFGLQNISIEPDVSSIDEKTSAELFKAFLRNNINQ